MKYSHKGIDFEFMISYETMDTVSFDVAAFKDVLKLARRLGKRFHC